MSYKRKQQEIVCENCNGAFMKDVSEIKRNSNIGRKNYCSISCSKSIKSNLEHLSSVRSTDVSNLKPGNRLDEYSLFRQHLRRAIRRKTFCNLTLEEMKEVWDSQNGICVYSNIKMIEASYKEYNDPIYTMSLDRINSDIGYIKSNIQFITIAMNYLKNSMTDEKMREVLQILRI